MMSHLIRILLDDSLRDSCQFLGHLSYWGLSIHVGDSCFMLGWLDYCSMVAYHRFALLAVQLLSVSEPLSIINKYYDLA